ncbi:hypothetical protein MVES_003364 [Malassezia vespertilionis]|uniref:Uncharacterized protein n=1 Tax=Malassezia vespertilionis TaxID=2020962 RepID=A0A2N1J848_9BASI|nr:hypothetical protein MVES_003364 [Malassezia vespertilionis]
MTTSRPALASEDNRGDMHPAFPPGFEKLGQSPDALAALQQLTKVLQQNGVDVTGKTRPSMVQLATLATKKEVREATAKVGVDLTPERLQSLMNGDFSSK